MKKLTIQAMQQLAESQGGKCLSDVYVNAQSKLLWQCAEGHRWTARPDMIQQGQWCPYCAGVAKLTIDAMHRLAETRGGKCLSDTYVDSRTPILWECSEGHRWKAIASNVKRGTWCPVCAGFRKRTIEDMRNLAAQHGGQCLSGVYKGNKTRLLWQCKAGHQWEAIPHSVLGGTWCPIYLYIPEYHPKYHLRGSRQPPHVSAVRHQRLVRGVTRSFWGYTPSMPRPDSGALQSQPQSALMAR
jgi:hypothetical protein